MPSLRLAAPQKLHRDFLSSFYYRVWKGVLAIVLWPYYLGANFSSLAR